MTLPLSLHAYRLATRLLTPLSGALIGWRLKRGKEDRRRWPERRGLASIARPKGALVWLHGASVGEATSLLPLVDRLTQGGRNVLVTTGTVSSANLLAQRLPAGAVHQFAPFDAPLYVRRFLEHWRPELALFAESELWPNLLLETSRAGAPIVLVNARMSARSFARWRNAPQFIGALLARLDLCLAQSQGDADRLAQLGAPQAQVSGNLKYDVPAPPADRAQLAALSGLTSGRPIWIAASTHEGEEMIAARAHGIVAATRVDLLTLVAPRHCERGPAIAAQLRAAGFACALRSERALPGPEVSIYICDTMGELGLFYRLAGVVLLGKSLTGEGGQNPIEPAKLASAILHGPNVANFDDIYALLDAVGGATTVVDAPSLAAALNVLFGDGAKMRAMARAAAQAVEGRAGAVERAMRALERYLAPEERR